MSKRVLSVTYEQIDQWIASIQIQLIQEEFVCIIGILRGGGPIALMASHATGAPVAFLRYDRAAREVSWDSSIPIPDTNSKVLLCEDISGVGNTLSDCREFLRQRGLKVRILTAGFDDKSIIRPDYGIDGRGYFLLFPWERQSFTDEYRRHWIKTRGGTTSAMGNDHDYDTYAIDLDGILLPDISPARYEANLERALLERDDLEPFSLLPAHKRVEAIITGRPEMDRDRTLLWLRQYGYGEVELRMRDTARYDDSPGQVALHKARAALDLACTHFIESDPVQAVLISTAAPLLRVIWWDAITRQAKLISSSELHNLDCLGHL
ncbi:phosphoribosyltransferase [Pseudomonas brassicacearum]|uniref:phosphoribosyltransferase n=1 Tax=Pseudomonas brassicacearum TaxID=930166 RepID=UPI000F485BC3|nr:phosphoribosyltransferase [Pseudomonas brassicacearum]ROM72234.1 phosphoribosyltransferase [Pseudomonas brassicacearum]